MKLVIPVLLLCLSIVACSPPPPPSTQAPLPASQFLPQPKPLTQPSFIVGPNQYLTFDFTNTSVQTISGRFQAQGGSGNDIQVFILDNDQMTNWMNHHATSTWFNSGKITVGSINVRLNPGTYHLIFDNTFSAISSKAITSNVQIQ